VNPATENDVRFYALMICAVTVTPHWFATVFAVVALLVVIQDARQRTAEIRKQGDGHD
jgi:hypothetical protein